MEKHQTVDEFFNNLPKEETKESDIFNDVKDENTPPKKETEEVVTAKDSEKETEDVEPRKNRRHRRLEEQLQKERESNIALNERVKVLSEVKKYSEDHSDVDPRLIRAFGTTEEGKEATKLFQELLNDTRKKAEEAAVERVKSEQQEEKRMEKEFQSMIDSELERLEDSFDVDLTSNAPAARKARTEFLEMVKKLSPKDENGVITGYADFDTTFEIYQERRNAEKTNTTISRQKEIASRSMQKTGSGTTTAAPKQTPGFFGWKKDYGMN